jgi:GAF domain-containing protein
MRQNPHRAVAEVGDLPTHGLPPRVIVAGLNASQRECLEGRFTILDVNGPIDLGDHLSKEDAAVLVLGPLLRSSESHQLLSAVLADYPQSWLEVIILSDEPDLDAFQEFVESDRVFYVSRGALPPQPLTSLVTAAARRASFDTGLRGRAPLANELLDFCYRLSAQESLSGFCAVLTEAALWLVGANRAQCLLYDSQLDYLWRPDRSSNAESDNESRQSAAVGIASYSLRTAESVRLEDVAQDPRYDAEVDDPGGDGHGPFLCQPIQGTGTEVIAVLTASDRDQQGEFTQEDAQILRALADHAAPLLGALLQKRNIQVRLKVQTRRVHGKIFREEALDHHSAGSNQRGNVLKTLHPWLNWAHWLVLGFIGVLLASAMLVRIDRKIAGQAVLHARDKTLLKSPVSGIVRSVEVFSGHHVRAGDPLISFFADDGVSPTLIRSPLEGVVAEIDIGAGQRISAGDPAMSLFDQRNGYEVLALLPADSLRQVRPGLFLAMKFENDPDPVSVPIARVGAVPVGSREAARITGQAVNENDVDRFVVIEASFPPVPGDSRSYYDGMSAKAEIRTGAEPILFRMMPGLKIFAGGRPVVFK